MDLGLSRYFSNEEDRTAAIERLVRDGHARRLREIIFKKGNDVDRIFEAARDGDQVVTRWLAAEEVAPIQEAVRHALRDDTYITFSFRELDEVYHIESLQNLAFNLQNDPGFGRVTVNLADGVSAHATHVKRSERDWQDVDDRAWVACELHYIVKTHDLILHSE